MSSDIHVACKIIYFSHMTTFESLSNGERCYQMM